MRQQMDVNLFDIDFASIPTNFGYSANIAEAQMAAESLPCYSSTLDFRDSFEDILDSPDFFQDDLSMDDLFNIDPRSCEFENDMWLFTDAIDEDEMNLSDVFEDAEMNILDFVVGDSPISSDEFEFKAKGVGAANAFGLLDEFEKVTEFDFKTIKEEDSKSAATESNWLPTSVSEFTQNPVAQNRAGGTMPKTCTETKTNASKARTRPMGSKGSKLKRGSKGRLLGSKGRPDAREQVMEEHGYTKRTGKTSPKEKSNNSIRINDQKQARSNVNNAQSSAKAIISKNSSAEEQKPNPLGKDSFLETVVKGMSKQNISSNKATADLKINQRSVRSSSDGEKPILANGDGSQILNASHGKTKQGSLAAKDYSSSKHKSMSAEPERKMVSILNRPNLNLSPQNQCTSKEGWEVNSRSQTPKKPEALPATESSDSSPDAGGIESVKENPSTKEDVQQQPEHNSDAKEKNKKKLSLLDYKMLKQKSISDKPECSNHSSKATSVGDHNYCMPIEDVSDKFQNQVPNKAEQNPPSIEAKEQSQVNVKDIAKKDLDCTSINKQEIGKHGKQISENFSSSQGYVLPDKTRRDPFRRIECENFRKRKASPERSTTKRPAREESHYANNSWNASVLTVFELPGRKNSKYSNSTGFPSDASTVSSPSQRSRSRSSSVSSNSSSNSTFEEKCRQARQSRSRSPEDDYRERRDHRGPRKSGNQQKAIEERRIVYIGGLPPDFTKYDLQRKMERFGTIIETSIHKRSRDEYYGFITFATTQQAANAKQDGHRVQGCEKFDFSYGGRREFCGTRYSDLDHDAIYKSKNSTSSQSSDFQDLLRQTMSMVQKSKRKS